MGFLTGISLRTWLYGAAVLAILAGVGMFSHSRYAAGEAAADARHAIADKKTQDAADKLLAAETAKVAAAEKHLADFKGKQELTDVANSNAIDDLAGQLRVSLRSSAARSRLCGGGPVSPNPTAAGAGAGDAAVPDRGIPDAASDFLGRLVLDADRINAAYASCRAERLNLTTVTPSR